MDQHPGPPDTADAPSARRWAAPRVLLWAAAITYNDWVLEFLLPTGIDPANSYVSELYAADQPFRHLFASIEVVTATLVTAAALFVARPSAGRPGGWWAMAGFGMCSLADVALPMSCAPSVEPDCEAVHPLHTLTSALVHLFLFLAMALLILAARRSGDRAPELASISRWGPWLLPAAMAAAIATVGPLLGHPGGQGIPQRIHLLLVGVWLALLAQAAEQTRGVGSRRGRLPTPLALRGGWGGGGDGAGVAVRGVVRGEGVDPGEKREEEGEREEGAERRAARAMAGFRTHRGRWGGRARPRRSWRSGGGGWCPSGRRGRR
nr:DUF998 domain-containing protein [Streptomyces sp. MJM8645]